MRVIDQPLELPGLAANLPLFRTAGVHQAPTRISRLLLTYLLLWPLLCFVARQAPYFSGPARDATSFQQGRSAGEGSDYWPIFYLLMATEAMFAASCARGILSVLKRNPFVPAGLALVLLSALWSGSRSNTLHLWLQLSISTLFACYLTVRMRTEQLMRQFMFVGLAASLLSVLFVFALPGYGIFAGYAGGAWQGICNHKNTLGLSMVYLLTPALFLDCRRWQRATYILLVLFLIAMSQSRGAWLYTLGVLSFVGCLHLVRRLKKHESLLLVMILCLLFAAAAVAASTYFDTVTSALGKNGSMSGRSDIYREVWISVGKAPILGYGYNGFWGVSPEAARVGLSIGWTNIGYSESGILEVLLQLGFVGVALVVWMIVKAWIQGIRLLRSPHYSPRLGWFLTILLLAALTNIDAGCLLATGTLDWLMILIACIGLDA